MFYFVFASWSAEIDSGVAEVRDSAFYLKHSNRRVDSSLERTRPENMRDRSVEHQCGHGVGHNSPGSGDMNAA